jgi:hypothetical protein
MFTIRNENIRHSLGTAAAVCVIALAGLALEFGHAGALPAGSVEVGELQPVNLEQLAAVTLPGIVVTAGRLPADAAPQDLPAATVRLASRDADGRDAAG